MFDSFLPDSKDHLPLTWWKQRPIYLAAFIAMAAVASMIVFAILGPTLMVSWFAFSMDALQDWKLWTPATYALVNAPGIWPLVGCFMLWRFGEEVERHLGRRIFVSLLLVLLFSSPVMHTLLHFAGFRGPGAAGITNLNFAVFVAFATLYPRAKLNMLIVTVDAWLLAAIFVGINALQLIAFRAWIPLLLLVVNVGAAFLFIRYQKGELRLPSFAFLKPRPKPRAVRNPGGSRSPGTAVAAPKGGGKKAPTVDDILDKISRHGMHSLTTEERRILDKASKDMK